MMAKSGEARIKSPPRRFLDYFLAQVRMIGV